MAIEPGDVADADVKGRPRKSSSFWAHARARCMKILGNLPVGLRVAVWLVVFLSPTVYALLVASLSRAQVPAPPGWLIVGLFCLIPVVALVVCGALVWVSNMRKGWRAVGLVLTVLGMALQVGALAVIIVSAITVAISPA
jgi:hypothetical protein